MIKGDPPPYPRVGILVHNAFVHDARVLNTARSVRATGASVTVLAVPARGLPDEAWRDGLRIVRVPFDPIDTRLWRNRSRVSRPWRFRGRAIAWVRDAAATGPRGWPPAVLRMVAVLIALPWVAFTLAYHYGIRLLDRPLASIGRARPSAVVGGWLEGKARAIVFAVHRPLRLRDWGTRIRAMVDEEIIEDADIWHANDLETLPVALELRRRAGQRVIYDSHEIFLEAAGRARLGRFRRSILAWAERRWIHRADAVVTVNAAVAEELVRRYRIDPPLVIRNCPPLWSPPEGFRSPLRAAVAGAGGDPNRPILISHGGFQAGRGFEELLVAAETLSEYTIVFLGFGPLEQAFRARAATERWRNRLIILPAVDPDELLGWLAGADLSVSLIQPDTLNHRLSTPNKLFEALAAGLPVLVSNFAPMVEIVGRFGVGRTVNPTDRRAIRAAIVDLLSLPDARREALRTKALAAAQTELNWEHEVAGLLALYDRLAPARTV